MLTAKHFICFVKLLVFMTRTLFMIFYGQLNSIYKYNIKNLSGQHKGYSISDLGIFKV